jgi:GDSL-like Lipase/Acylhydrolase family
MTGRRRLITTIVMVWVLVGCGSAQTAPGPPTPLPQQPACQAALEQRPLCVLILGDSIAAGSPLSGDDRWWVRLAAGLGSALTDRRVVVDSWAVPGSHVDVLESAARDQPALGSYDVAIAIEGVNDETSLPIDAWRARYEAAIAAIEGRGLIVVVGTPPPDFEGGAFTTRYDPIAAALRDAAAGRRPLLDIAARWRVAGAAAAAAYYYDHIHQGTVGQRLMAEMARDVVLEAIGHK